MADLTNWAFPAEYQPRQDDFRFDLAAVLDAVVQLRAEVPEDAFTASILGTERVGNGVVIRDDGLVLTIGYLITEATSIWLTTNDGHVVEGYPLAYDQVTGFGLVHPLGSMNVPMIARGRIASCEIGDDVLVVGSGGRKHALKARVIGKREFAGYWEYVLDEAIFTAPAHPQWGGAALVGADGRLLGIGSLFVEETVEGEKVQGNMIVPIDLLEPILDDMLRTGRANRPARPWLGLYAAESKGHLVVGGLAEGGPAEQADIRPGDLLLEAGGKRVNELADLFRTVWKLGPAGIDVPLTLGREGKVVRVSVKSVDRADLLKKPRLH